MNLPPVVAIQFWSRGGITPEIREQIEAVLTGAETGQMGVETNSSSVEIASKADSCPDANDPPERLFTEANGTQTLSNMEEVRRSVEALSRYASDGFARMRVIKELKRAKLIPLKKK